MPGEADNVDPERRYERDEIVELTERAFYEAKFRASFLEKTGDEFQTFFGDIMSRGYPADYMRTRPWGKNGDRKNDGYLKSKRILFQIYAPDEMKEAEAKRKIKEDLKEALPYWEQYFDTWVFAHNARRGLGPGQTRTILELRETHKEIEITDWGFEPIRNELFRLSDVDIAMLLGIGRAPNDYALMQVRYEQLKFVIFDISRKPANLDPDLRAVPVTKIDENGFSDPVKILLNEGRKKSHLVEGFFNDYPDKTVGEGLAETFRQRYLELRDGDKSPDEIYYALHRFAGGYQQPDEVYEAAVLTVLSYFFEKCAIFERPQGHY